MINITPKIIIGLGTGRCGTVFLSEFLKHQPKTESCSHESIKYTFTECNINTTYKQLKDANCINKQNSVAIISAFALLGVDEISKFFQETKLIILIRNKDKLIKSFMNWTKDGPPNNYWVPNTKNIWHQTSWECYFPKFPELEEKTKEEAISAYYDYYYDICNILSKKYDSLWINTEYLNDINTLNKILDFCGLDKPGVFGDFFRNSRPYS